ncbi:hypothetical protein D3C76_118760 [compost metagenome]
MLRLVSTLLILSIIMILGCSNQLSNHEISTSTQSIEVNSNSNNSSNSIDPIETIESQPNSTIDTSASEATDSYVDLEEGYTLYTNTRLGFSLNIPNSWRGSYRIAEELNNDGIDFFFIGESQTSKNVSDSLDADSPQGLYLFSISTESSISEGEELVDSVREIGSVGSTRFVSYTGTDCSICILIENDDEVDKQEESLLKQDWQMASMIFEERSKVFDSFSELKD